MPIQYAESPREKLQCLVCGAGLEMRLAKGRRSGKAFLMAVCPRDGRHIRAFINDPDYVQGVLARLAKKAGSEGVG